MDHTIETLDYSPAVTESVPEPVGASWVEEEVEVSVATYQAYKILYFAFIALFAIAGADKLVHLLTSWDSLVAPRVAALFHTTAGGVAMGAGLIEIAIAAVIALKPRIGSWLMAGWIGLIVIDLFLLQGHAELVLQNLGLLAASVAFTRLSAECN